MNTQSVQRHVQVAHLMLQGNEVPQIAQRLDLSLGTVRSYVSKARKSGLLERHVKRDITAELSRIRYRETGRATGVKPLGSMTEVLTVAGIDVADWLFRQTPDEAPVAATIGAILRDVYDQETKEMDKYLLVDCDGVLLNWEEGFRLWLHAHHEIKVDHKGPDSWDLAAWVGHSSDRCQNLIAEFNSSEDFGCLNPMPGAKPALELARRRGYQVVVVTACSSDPEVVARRESNLHGEYFGLINDIHCVPLRATKADVLAEFPKGSLWVEDNYNHALAGALIGHEAFCLRQRHNRATEIEAPRGKVRWIDGWHSVLPFID